MKEHIDVLGEADRLTKALKSTGILINTQLDGRINAMTMGWAFIGRLWQVPYIMSFVRGSRFTKTLLDKSGVYTISVPDESTDRKILAYCGTRSGRDTDKIKDLGLTPEEAEKNGVPGFKELPLTIECRLLYSQLMDRSRVPRQMQEEWYSDEDYHWILCGQVLSAYYIR